jgi:hypothetical protein
MDVSDAKPHRAPAFAEAPLDLHGPNFAFPSAVGTRETKLAAPVLPDDIDRAPMAKEDSDD